MIRPLRQRHHRIVMALGVVLPVAFAIGIAARKPVPELDSVPGELAPANVQWESPEWRRADLFPKSPVQVRLMREHRGVGKWAVALSAGKDFVKPDLLVYWVAGNSRITNTLPDQAILVGSFSATPIPLSEEIATSSGQLVLFSLADNEIVDVSKPVQFNDPMR